MANVIATLTFDRETLRLTVDAPDMELDFLISMLERAMRQCENLDKVNVIQIAKQKAMRVQLP